MTPSYFGIETWLPVAVLCWIPIVVVMWVLRLLLP
jgi:hypothetical protein